MEENYIQMPSDGSGKRVRTNTTIINGQKVHSDVMVVSDPNGSIISPAKENGNLADIKANTDNIPSNPATSSKQDSIISGIEKMIGFEIPPYDYIELTYVESGNGAGEIETVTYKTGGSGGTTVATLTLSYDSSNRVINITKT